MQVIDFHAHIYPDKVARKASQAISEFYEAPMRYTGLVAELLTSGANIGVERYVVHSTATRADQVVSINDYVIREIARESRFIGFGTIHPDFPAPDVAGELARITAAGLKGIKLHPDFQKFEADSPTMDAIYDQIAAAGMPVLIHAGDRRFDYSGPRRISRILDKHPRLQVIAAHFGGYTEWDETVEVLAGRDLWFDTSSSLWKIPRDTALRLIRTHGSDRFLFGTDFPMWDHAEELERFLSLGLSERENHAILYGNAAAFLKNYP